MFNSIVLYIIFLYLLAQKQEILKCLNIDGYICFPIQLENRIKKQCVLEFTRLHALNLGTQSES